MEFGTNENLVRIKAYGTREMSWCLIVSREPERPLQVKKVCDEGPMRKKHFLKHEKVNANILLFLIFFFKKKILMSQTVNSEKPPLQSF